MHGGWLCLCTHSFWHFHSPLPSPGPDLSWNSGLSLLLVLHLPLQTTCFYRHQPYVSHCLDVPVVPSSVEKGRQECTNSSLAHDIWPWLPGSETPGLEDHRLLYLCHQLPSSSRHPGSWSVSLGQILPPPHEGQAACWRAAEVGSLGPLTVSHCDFLCTGFHWYVNPQKQQGGGACPVTHASLWSQAAVMQSVQSLNQGFSFSHLI